MEQDQNLLRIKKLLICACHQQWENNPQTLQQADLAPLVQEMLRLAPTWQELETELNRIVKTLNKAAEYALVANSILQYIKPLYLEPETQLIRSPHFTFHHHYLEISGRLDCDQQYLRVKKLLVAACGYPWENDPYRLNAIATTDLVQTLHQLAPDLERLSVLLSGIVQTLNRQVEYQAIAATIIQAFSSLYDSTEVAPAPPELETSIRPVKPVKPVKPVEAVEERLPVLNSPATAPPPLSASELFDLRFELMKYTNPWRTKRLAVAVIHADINEPDQTINTALKLYELDDLLQELFTTYPHYEQLIEQLKLAAAPMKQRDEYTQTISAIARAFKPYYFSSRQSTHLINERPIEVEKVTEIVVGQPKHVQLSARDHDEHTCQFRLPEVAPATQDLPTQAEPPASSNASETSSDPIGLNRPGQTNETLFTRIRSLFGEQP